MFYISNLQKRTHSSELVDDGDVARALDLGVALFDHVSVGAVIVWLDVVALLVLSYYTYIYVSSSL
jgi:hypothetical protein